MSPRVIFRTPLNKLTEADINKLEDERVPEGLFIEYKRDFPKKQIAKSVACFANAHGGYLLLGVTADKETNVIKDMRGIDLEDGLKEKVKNVIAAHVEPIPIFRVGLVPLGSSEGKCVVIVWVPESDLTPHILTDSGVIYRRTAEGCEQVSDRFTLDYLHKKGERGRQALRKRLERAMERGSNRVPFQHIMHIPWGFQIIVCPIASEQILIPDLFSKGRFIEFKNGSSQLLLESFEAGMGQDMLTAFSDFDSGAQKYFRAARRYVTMDTRGVIDYLYGQRAPEEGSTPDIKLDAIKVLVARMAHLAFTTYQSVDFWGSAYIRLVLYHVGEARLSQIRIPALDVEERMGPALEDTIIISRQVLVDDLRDEARLKGLLESIERELKRSFGEVVYESGGLSRALI